MAPGPGGWGLSGCQGSSLPLASHSRGDGSCGHTPPRRPPPSSVGLSRGRCSPPGRACQCLETAVVVTPGGRSCSWHLVCRDQGCCSTAYCTQGVPTSESDPVKTWAGPRCGAHVGAGLGVPAAGQTGGPRHAAPAGIQHLLSGQNLSGVRALVPHLTGSLGGLTPPRLSCALQTISANQCTVWASQPTGPRRAVPGLQTLRDKGSCLPPPSPCLQSAWGPQGGSPRHRGTDWAPRCPCLPTQCGHEAGPEGRSDSAAHPAHPSCYHAECPARGQTPAAHTAQPGLQQAAGRAHGEGDSE